MFAKVQIVLINSKLSRDAEFFRLTRRQREGVVRYVERAATQSDGKRTVTAGVYQQPLGIVGKLKVDSGNSK